MPGSGGDRREHGAIKDLHRDKAGQPSSTITGALCLFITTQNLCHDNISSCLVDTREPLKI